MTTYTLAGYSFSIAGGNLDLTGESTLSLFVPEGGATTFSYTVNGDLPLIETSSIEGSYLMLDNETFPFLSDVFLMDLIWSDNGQTRHTTMLAMDVIEEHYSGSTYYTGESQFFYLDGYAFPTFNSSQQMIDFINSFTAVNIAASPYAPGQNIALTTLFDTASENDTVLGTSGDDYIDTGSGDDEIYFESKGSGAAYSGGNDTLIGGAGDDSFYLDNVNATVDGGEGTDQIVVADGGGEIFVNYAGVSGQNALRITNANASDSEMHVTNVEHVLTQSVGPVYVRGNDADNVFGISEQPHVLEYNGGGGEDLFDLAPAHDGVFSYTDMTLERFLNRTNIQGSVSSVTFHDITSDFNWAVLNDVEWIRFYDQTISVADLFEMAGNAEGATYTTAGNDTISASDSDFGARFAGQGGDDQIFGGEWEDALDGGGGADTLNGNAGDDRLLGGAGTDVLIGGVGDDTLYGGIEPVFYEGIDPLYSGGAYDLSDTLYAGEGNDSLDGGYGNDELRGDAGNDTIVGGFGADTVIGGTGDDVMTGQAWSDLMFGGDGDDFINGGFGSDRVNGGAGADRFYHLGIADHGSDWIQDYEAGDGDVLVFGDSTASVDDFQVNFAETANAGIAGIEEAFVIYRPTGQIVWALVDGGDQDEITLRIAGVDYDLLA